MDDERLIEEGLAGRLPAGSPEFERFVDITARRPAGQAGAAHYRDPTEHEASFAAALAELRLGPQDSYLEVGVGGGQLLERALEHVATAAGIDHSPAMLALTRERNSEAVRAGRLELVEGDLHELPWPDEAFTRAACVNAFFFIERPAAFLAEVRRVLAPDGRFVLVTAAQSAAWNSPWAPALLTYESRELERMLRAAGFSDVEVDDDAQQIAVAATPPARATGPAPA